MPLSSACCAALRVRQADPHRGARDALREGRHAHHGRPVLIVVVGGAGTAAHALPRRRSTFAPLATLALVGALGAADDCLNARTGDGIRAARSSSGRSSWPSWRPGKSSTPTTSPRSWCPSSGAVGIPAWAYIVFAAFAIVATSNGVNITDGLDGLAGGHAHLRLRRLHDHRRSSTRPLAQPNLAVLCALIIGALLGFLWFNVHPAQIIMGDSGSLSLGATLAVTALITGQILLLPLIGIIFVVETGSVILQVAYFKLTGGRRIFRMARSTTTSSWPAGTRRRSRSASGSSASSRRCSAWCSSWPPWTG